MVNIKTKTTKTRNSGSSRTLGAKVGVTKGTSESRWTVITASVVCIISPPIPYLTENT